MKTILLTIASCFLFLLSFSQTNGWYQYHKGTQITDITTDTSGKIYITTDSGFMMYNPATNLVEDYANLTSQSQPIGRCTSVDVNPVNNNVALGFPSNRGIAIYDGTDYTIYHSGNSDIEDFVAPQLYYTDNGLLYVFDTTDSKYQTFENGVFGAVQNLTFWPQAIIENVAGNLVYFAGRTLGGLADGLYELDKATDIYTKYTSSNSDLAHNGVNCFFRDTNDLLYIGGARGVNTLDAMGNWATYQEPLPINPSVFYSAFSIDKFSDGTFLVNNSNPNSSEERGFSTVDFTTNTWTHFDSSVYCNASDQVQNMILVNDIIYTHFRKFSNPSDDYKLWSYETSTNTCQEEDVNHLNVADLGNFGTSGLNIRQDPDDANAKDVLWVNNGGASVKSLSIPNSFFGGSYSDSEDDFTASQALNSISSSSSHYLVGGESAVWCRSNIGATANFGLGVNDFNAFRTQFVTANSSPQSVGVIFGGWKNNTTYEDYKAKIDLTNNTISAPEQINYITTNDGPTNSACFLDETVGVRCFKTYQTSAGNIKASEVNWDFNGNSAPITLYEDDISTINIFAPDPYKGATGESLWFQGTIDGQNYLQAGGNGEPRTYVGQVVDSDGDGFTDDLVQANFNSEPYITNHEAMTASIFFASSPSNPTSGTDNAKLIQIIKMRRALNGSDLNRSEQLNTEVIPNSSLENLPQDFYVLDSSIYVYSDTHFATVLSTTYGLLINTAIDYSSLSLGVDEVASNDILKLYPNPANDVVSLTEEHIKSVEIFDINGRSVLTSKSNTFPVKHLENGIYIVKILGSDKSVVTQKLIKR